MSLGNATDGRPFHNKPLKKNIVLVVHLVSDGSSSRYVEAGTGAAGGAADAPLQPLRNEPCSHPHPD